MICPSCNNYTSARNARCPNCGTRQRQPEAEDHHMPVPPMPTTGMKSWRIDYVARNGDVHLTE